jgi:hypothetical protein
VASGGVTGFSLVAEAGVVEGGPETPAGVDDLDVAAWAAPRRPFEDGQWPLGDVGFFDA